ncbi:hypothetical protein ACIBO2_23320 [Nonomuraea sp. NPDC050022]|uniref:hypothetical protein n=1 Tax=unclassified Nonomuraea TaxID=2593643 RepID=UPI0033F7F2F5
MKDKVQMGLAIAAGYYLGRRHKLRWATTLAVAGVLSRLRGQGGLLSQGIKMLGSSPEMDKLTGRLRGELMDVGKAAAVAMTSRQLESLTSRLHERAEGLRHPGTPEETAEDEEDYEEGYEEEEEEAPEEEPPKPAPRRRKPKAEPARAARPVTRTRRRA